MIVTAKEIKKGDYIMLDCGYDAPTYDFFKVLRVDNTLGLFDNEARLSFRTKDGDREFNTCDFKYDDKIITIDK